jgi:hypothetical protein
MYVSDLLTSMLLDILLYWTDWFWIKVFFKKVYFFSFVTNVSGERTGYRVNEIFKPM